MHCVAITLERQYAGGFLDPIDLRGRGRFIGDRIRRLGLRDGAQRDK